MKIPKAFSDKAQLRTVAAGGIIFSAGEMGEEMFIVQEGEVDIFFGGKVIETIGPEQFFGEMALIDHSPRSATAVARTNCVLLPLNQHRFTYLVDEVPFFALAVMKVMANRLRRAWAATQAGASPQ